MLGPNQKRLPWDDLWMLQAVMVSRRSPDPGTQVGCMLVSKDNKPLGEGYNGVPRGIDPDCVPWDRDGPPESTKYARIIHAERNAINNCVANTCGSRCFVTLQPCNNCAGDIIQAGISEVIYLSDKYKDVWFTKVAEEMFQIVGVSFYKHKWESEEALRIYEFITKEYSL